MSKVIRLSHPTGEINGFIQLDGSKSISNRALIIQALSGEKIELSGLSTSHDTETLAQMLATESETMDSGHAGTSFRFSVAYAAVGDRMRILTGSDRMKQRPIGPLVDALNEIGAQIEYLEKKGYPPLKVTPIDKKDYGQDVYIEAGISSQYISAILMIAPHLPNGLRIHLEGDLVSKPYVDMTCAMMDSLGVKCIWEANTIQIPAQKYTSKPIEIEADWSAASYYFAIAAIAKKCDLRLGGLHLESLQGDQAIVEMAEIIGLKALHEHSKWALISEASDIAKDAVWFDFTTCPDTAQTWAVIAAACQIPMHFTGLQTLVIKETNRIEALQIELAKIGCNFVVTSETADLPLPNQVYQVIGIPNFDRIPRFSTYQDHRMAMAFAPFALFAPIEIEEPDVVKKSYPGFWKDLESLGFEIEEM